MKINLTEAAQRAILDLAREMKTDLPLRIAINDRFEHELDFDQRTMDDEDVYGGGGVNLIIDSKSAQRADGLMIDFIDRNGVQGFKIENPNAPPGIKQLSPSELKEMLDSEQSFEFADVRTPQERELAVIARARLLDQSYVDELLAKDKNTPIVFHCHHGMRSQSAAEFFLSRGFRKLYNLSGGIDAWSSAIDPRVPRY